MTTPRPSPDQVTATPVTPTQVTEFWRQAGPEKWFAKDDDFDARFRERFLVAHEAAAQGDLTSWQAYPEGALALVLLLDQFPRNAFRDTPRMYATDELARRYADAALAAGFDRHVDDTLRPFFYLPYSHSESLTDQERAVSLQSAPDFAPHAKQHCEIVRRFGRFPHRNVTLGRQTTPEELAFLSEGGFHG